MATLMLTAYSRVMAFKTIRRLTPKFCPNHNYALHRTGSQFCKIALNMH